MKNHSSQKPKKPENPPIISFIATLFLFLLSVILSGLVGGRRR